MGSWFFEHKLSFQMTTRMPHIMKAKPPITPPMIAPVELLAVFVVVAGRGVTIGVHELAPVCKKESL